MIASRRSHILDESNAATCPLDLRILTIVTILHDKRNNNSVSFVIKSEEHCLCSSCDRSRRFMPCVGTGRGAIESTIAQEVNQAPTALQGWPVPGQLPSRPTAGTKLRPTENQRGLCLVFGRSRIILPGFLPVTVFTAAF